MLKPNVAPYVIIGAMILIVTIAEDVRIAKTIPIHQHEKELDRVRAEADARAKDDRQ